MKSYLNVNIKILMTKITMRINV